jgi:aspartyl-tRNA(Asn)/glutamyl-tRNA(Gln) amidotransferase subunit C
LHASKILLKGFSVSITKKDVLYVADLARLALEDDEVELYTTQLQRIISYVEKLSALDTKGVLPLAYTVTEGTPMRDDVVTSSLNQEDALANAPGRAKGCFKVPKIIE